MVTVRQSSVRSPLTSLLGAVVLFSVAACSSSGSGNPTTTSAPASSAGGAVTQVEVNPPGDIPDNQAFVPTRDGHVTVSVPEGWARLAHGNAVTFSDKYNSVTSAETAAASAPTVASATANELPVIRRTSQRFAAGPVSSVTRAGGSAVLLKYRALSPVNDVTGKAALLDVERYEFWRAGREAVLTLAAPAGSDNVDPWRTITDSFRWTS